MDTSFNVWLALIQHIPISKHSLIASFADNQLTDAIRALASEPSTDAKVKRKLVSVLASWHSQFKDDPSMSSVANLYNTVKPHQAAAARASRHIEEDTFQIDAAGLGGAGNSVEERRRREERERRERKEEEKRKAREAKEARGAEKAAEKTRLKQMEQEKRRSRGTPKRPPFNFEAVRLVRDFGVQTLIVCCAIHRRNLKS